MGLHWVFIGTMLNLMQTQTQTLMWTDLYDKLSKASLTHKNLCQTRSRLHEYLFWYCLIFHPTGRYDWYVCSLVIELVYSLEKRVDLLMWLLVQLPVASPTSTQIPRATLVLANEAKVSVLMPSAFFPKWQGILWPKGLWSPLLFIHEFSFKT